jgi:Ca2+-binding RTX toxin-like protein
MSSRIVECEPLESRRLMALTIDTVWQAVGAHITARGTLVIKGGADADTIAIVRDGNLIKHIRLPDGGGSRVIDVIGPASKVKRVLVEAGGGDDRVFIDEELRKPVTVVGGAGNDIIDDNRGATLIGGAGDDKLSVPLLRTWLDGPDSIPGVTISQNGTPSLLCGGDGNDVLVASSVDSVVGGRGNDLAIERAGVIDVPAAGVNPQADFGQRAQGIEGFDAALVELNQRVLVELK